MLTCKHGRRAVGVPLDVQPNVAPAPPAIAPEQVQDVAAAARVLQNGSVEEHVRGVAVGGLLPRFGDEVLVFPEGLKHLRIEANVARCDEAFQLLITDHRIFAALQRRFEADLRQVHFGELEGTLVFLDDGPAVTDKGDGVESGGTVDSDDLRNA